MKKSTLIVTLMLALPLLLASCRAPAPATVAPTTVDAQAVHTAAAATAGAILTAMVPPSETPPPPTATATLTPEVAPSPTGALPLFTATSTTAASTGQDASAFASETIPDGSEYAPNATLIKTWEFRNSGTTTWTTSYSLSFISGAQMGAPASIALPYSVAPGTIVPVSVNLTAPAEAGNYRGYWQLKNAAGQVFGVSVWVDINVVNATATTGATATVAPTVEVTPTP